MMHLTSNVLQRVLQRDLFIIVTHSLNDETKRKGKRNVDSSRALFSFSFQPSSQIPLTPQIVEMKNEHSKASIGFPDYCNMHENLCPFLQ